MDRAKVKTTSEIRGETTNEKEVTNESTFETADETELQLFDFVIVAVTTMANRIQYFAGQISEICDNEFRVNFLKRQGGNKFRFPEKEDVSYVSRNEIIRKLSEPTVNRRKQFIFEEIATLNVVVH